MQARLQDLKYRYRQAIKNLPWQTHQITLLLDGINVPNILPLLYANHTLRQFEVLYVQTRFSDLKDVSPCLIKLDSAASYPIDLFLDRLDQEWGYFLASQASWQEQVNHLRNLLVVEDGSTEQQMLLKLADPQVMTALLTVAAQEHNTALYGPFTHLLAANIIDQQINHLQRPSQRIAPLTPPYRLSLSESAALDQVDIKRANQHIYAHMQTYFPALFINNGEYNNQIDILISQAEQLGYSSVKEQLYYLNIYGYLGINALQENAQLANLVKAGNIESLKEAAELAKQLYEAQGRTV